MWTCPKCLIQFEDTETCCPTCGRLKTRQRQNITAEPGDQPEIGTELVAATADPTPDPSVSATPALSVRPLFSQMINGVLSENRIANSLQRCAMVAIVVGWVAAAIAFGVLSPLLRPGPIDLYLPEMTYIGALLVALLIVGFTQLLGANFRGMAESIQTQSDQRDLLMHLIERYYDERR